MACLLAQTSAFAYIGMVNLIDAHDLMRQWPDTGALVLLLLSTAGALSGIKITMLTLLLPPTQLGPLADDKGALIIGGLATLTLSLKEAVASWRKLTGI